MCYSKAFNAPSFWVCRPLNLKQCVIFWSQGTLQIVPASHYLVALAFSILGSFLACYLINVTDVCLEHDLG
jgi:hypothetical protein